MTAEPPTMNDGPEQQPQRVAYRFLATGIAAFFGGLGLWFAFLACNVVIFFTTLVRHAKKPIEHQNVAPASAVQTDWPLFVVYCMTFLIAAFVVARFRWSQRPAIAAPVAYAVFLAIYIPRLCCGDGHLRPVAGLCIPLITSAIGGYIGSRFWRRKP